MFIYRNIFQGQENIFSNPTFMINSLFIDIQACYMFTCITDSNFFFSNINVFSWIEIYGGQNVFLYIFKYLK